MANFEYIALDAKGEETTGSISATNEADAIAQLRKGGLYPTQVVAAGKGGVSGNAKRRAKKGQKAKGKKAKNRQKPCSSCLKVGLSCSSHFS